MLWTWKAKISPRPSKLNLAVNWPIYLKNQNGVDIKIVLLVDRALFEPWKIKGNLKIDGLILCYEKLSNDVVHYLFDWFTFTIIFR
jgi:hypothetical protein